MGACPRSGERRYGFETTSRGMAKMTDDLESVSHSGFRFSSKFARVGYA